MPQLYNKNVQIVVPTSLQLGRVKSPPYFCVAIEMSCDVAMTYIEMPVNSIPQHKFEKYVTADPECKALPETCRIGSSFFYMVEVYVDNFMSLVIPISQEQQKHTIFHPMTMIARTQSWKRNWSKGRERIAHKKPCWALILMVRKRQCGWKLQNKRNSLRSLRDGFKQVCKGPQASPSMNLN
jgi:hypothetical protein